MRFLIRHDGTHLKPSVSPGRIEANSLRHSMMHTVGIQIVRFVDASQPGWVECVLRDAWDREWEFVDKVPIFTDVPLDESSVYPQAGVIACEISREWRDAHGREIRTIDTSRPWGVEARSGEIQFDVLAEQISTRVA